jgi:hypothetical protein
MPLDLCIGSLGWYIYQAREIEKHEGEKMKKAVKTNGNEVSNSVTDVLKEVRSLLDPLPEDIQGRLDRLVL